MALQPVCTQMASKSVGGAVVCSDGALRSRWRSGIRRALLRWFVTRRTPLRQCGVVIPRWRCMYQVALKCSGLLGLLVTKEGTLRYFVIDRLVDW